MNLGMVELQSRLATQMTPVTQLQREAIREHPMRSVELLRASGVDDPDWLDAVTHHHVGSDGTGYPHPPQPPGPPNPMGLLLHYTDIYTAMLSARCTRAPMPANKAARTLFQGHQSDPTVMAVVKEFGVYPPGSYVALASGETGIVVKRGANANTPVVAALVNRRGQPMVEPVRRNSAQAENAIVDVIGEKLVRVRISTEKLLRLARD